MPSWYWDVQKLPIIFIGNFVILYVKLQINSEIVAKFRSNLSPMTLVV